ncbi:TIGR04190 family B12-binding domain/radical SAM domain protein [Candidatus Pyrohabitans sp.]
MKADLILLHPPSIFDFRERPILWGPINDLVPSTPVFEMYPLGFVSIASTLEKHGYRVRIVNIALRMLRDRNVNLEEYIRKMHPQAFGIDLHWLPHVHGALNLVKLCKRVHEDVPIVMGGLSASYFHEELLTKVPEVDYVLRGDSTEKPFVQLMESIAGERKLSSVDNLSYRNGSKVRVNPIRYVPENLDEFHLDYDYVFKKLIRARSLDMLPFYEFLNRPIMAVLTRKGCESNCIACGGSEYAYAKICGRHRVAFRKPEMVVRDILKIQEFRAPAFVLGDLAIGSQKYGLRVLELLRREGVDIPIIFEFFTPPPRGFLRELGRSVSDFTIEMSPESGDEQVREIIGRKYSNAALDKMIGDAFDAGCRQFDLYFMIGLGGQSRESIETTLKVAESLVEQHRGSRLLPFISPYAPFLDPGSIAFDNPEAHGFIKYAHTLMDHYSLLDRGLTWKDLLSYRTTHLSREDIVDLSYSSALRLAQIKANAGLISQETLAEIERRIAISKDMMYFVDAHRKQGTLGEEQVKASLRELMERLMIDRRELDWSQGLKMKRMLALFKKFLKSLF